MNGSKNRTGGQAALIVILLIIVLGLTGTTWHLYSLLGKAEETAQDNFKEQQSSTSHLKDSIEEVSQKVRSIKDDLYAQEDKTSRLEKDAASVKKAIDTVKEEIQKQVKDEVAAMKSDSKDSQEKARAMLARTTSQLEELSTQLKKLQEQAIKTTTPVIDVKLEAVETDSKKK